MIILFLSACAAALFALLVFATAAVFGCAFDFCCTVAGVSFVVTCIITVIVLSACALSSEISAHERGE